MLVPNRMFRNAGSRRFEDVTTDGDFGHLQKTHAIAFGDINNDGCQDVFAQTGGAYDSDVAFSALFANPGSRNHWLTLNLEGVRTNRSAIGARVRVTIASPDGTRDIYRAIGAGTGPLRAEIGLGNATSIDRVEILWPGEGGTQTLRGLAMDRFYRVTEGRNMAETLPRRAFRWPGMQEFTPVRAVRSKHLNSKRGRIARA
jgi:hypothetical protein